MPVPPEENIVRAICSDKWDGERIAPSLFVGSDTSVSRLAIIPLEEHWNLFRSYVEKPPERILMLIGEINVGKLQEIGRKHKSAVELTVEPKPESRNLAHAEIPQNITRGLANKICPELKLHHPPS